MKIAVASSGLGHVARGVEAWADNLAVELDRRGIDVTLFKGSGPVSRPFERVVPCLKRTARSARLISGLARHFFWRWGLSSAYGIEQITFAFNILPILKREKFQIVHLQDPLLALLLERKIASRDTKVILAHGSEEDFHFLLNFKYLQELTPHYIEEDRRKGVPAGKLWYAIPNFVDCEKFKPGRRDKARGEMNIANDRFVILDVAAMNIRHKRLDYLINEVALLKENNPRVLLILAGSATDELFAIRRLARKRLGDDALFFIDKPLDEMPGLYHAADIFAHGALFEMMPVALLESLASGVPVIANKNPVFEWIIGNGGVTIDMRQNGSLAAALKACIRDERALAEKAIAARAHVLENFEARKVTDRIVAMYEEVMKGE